MTRPNSEEPLAEGTILDGRYRLSRRIGRGGFAWVYEGQHVDLGRSAAVKILDLPTTETRDEFVERFLREARIIARLNHPNVVSVYDFGVYDETGQPYIAMELLRGHDLEHELAASGPLAPERAKQLFVGAAEALGAAHAGGVVHKDLKPSNLFLADPGTHSERLVLLDFGIAWALDDSGRLTKDGTFTGTPAYVAPEYARHLQVSPAVDVYQLGLILSEALSGVPCVRGTSSVQLILAHCQGDLVVPDQVQSSAFGPIVRCATAIDPSMRYADGRAMANALAEAEPSTMARMFQSGESFQAFTAEHLWKTSVENVTPTLANAPDTAPPQATTPAPVTAAGATVPGENRALIAALVAGLCVVGGIGAALSYERATPPPEAPPIVVVEPPTLPIVPVEPELVYPDLGTPLSATKFVVSTVPMGAAVYLGEELLGRTPVVLRGERVNGEDVGLRIELEGYLTADVQTGLIDGGRLDVDLVSMRPTEAPAQKLTQDQMRQLLESLDQLPTEP